MTLVCCWNHLEAAVVTEAAAIKAEARAKMQGGAEAIGAIITIQPNITGKCQVCGSNSLFSVYYQVV